MKTGKTLTELAAELDRQQAAKRDFIINTGELTALTSPETKETELVIPEIGEFPVNDLAHGQIAARLKIPKPYYDRLRDQHPAILDQNINGLFRREPKDQMVRTLDGNARAFLSNKFRIRDHYPLVQAILPILGKLPDVRFEACEVTEKRLYIKVVIPGVQGHLGDMVQPGHHVFLDKASPDYVQAGLVISNSEVGLGTLKIENLMFRLACLNGMIVSTAMRQYHVGRKIDAEESFELFRDETIEADDKAFQMKVEDVVNAACDQTQFDALVAQFRDAKEKPGVAAEDTVQGTQELAKRHGLNEREGNDVVKYLMAGGDLSLFGVVNAVTRASQDCPDFDRATEMERLGGTLLLTGV